MKHQRYAEYSLPRTFLGRWHMRWAQWRSRTRQEVADGRDYTGWRARVITLPAPDVRVSVGAEGVIARYQDDGERREHYIELPGETWVMALPSRHIELIPPTQ